MELEMRMLDRRYAGLRVLSPERLGGLVASLAEIGQQSPVLVVAAAAADGGSGGAERIAQGQAAVLIDGYRRVAVLERLGKDTVQALALDMDEAAALVLRHTLGQDERRSAFEDGWLLRELHDCHGLSQRELGVRLSRSASWVNRRLGLVRDLPESVQDLVRRGEVAPQAATKCLLPLARANTGAAEELAASLAGRRWSVREVEAVYDGWRAGTPEQRAHIVTSPGLYCLALAETQRSEPLPVADVGAGELAAQVDRLGGFCLRLRRAFRERLLANRPLLDTDVLSALWNEAEQRFGELRTTVREGLRRA